MGIEDEAHFDRLIGGLRTGNAEVLQEFMGRYRPALERLASRRIDRGLQRRVGPETIAQSVCRTFMRRTREGQFELTDGESLWGLLCALALTKIREKIRFHRRQKRDIDREVALDGAAEAAAPSPEAQVAFADQLEHEIASFSEEERLIFDLRLQGSTQEGIAAQAACSESTVRRVLKRMEIRLRAAFEAA